MNSRWVGRYGKRASRSPSNWISGIRGSSSLHANCRATEARASFAPFSTDCFTCRLVSTMPMVECRGRSMTASESADCIAQSAMCCLASTSREICERSIRARNRSTVPRSMYFLHSAAMLDSTESLLSCSASTCARATTSWSFWFMLSIFSSPRSVSNVRQ